MEAKLDVILLLPLKKAAGDWTLSESGSLF